MEQPDKPEKVMIDPARLEQYLTESLTAKLNEIEYSMGLDYTDTEGHITVMRHRKGRPDIVVLSQKFLLPRPPDIDELEQENKLLRARNERLEKELLEIEGIAQAKGWNSALELAAVLYVDQFKQAFGADTCASHAAWLRGHKLKEQKK